MEFRKMVMITVYMRQQKRHRCVEQSFGLCGRGRGWDDLGEKKIFSTSVSLLLSHIQDSVGEGESRMIWENGIEACIISFKKLITSPGSMQDTGCLGLVQWDDPEGWYGE